MPARTQQDKIKEMMDFLLRMKSQNLAQRDIEAYQSAYQKALSDYEASTGTWNQSIENYRRSVMGTEYDRAVAQKAYDDAVAAVRGGDTSAEALQKMRDAAGALMAVPKPGDPNYVKGYQQEYEDWLNTTSSSVATYGQAAKDVAATNKAALEEAVASDKAAWEKYNKEKAEWEPKWYVYQQGSSPSWGDFASSAIETEQRPYGTVHILTRPVYYNGRLWRAGTEFGPGKTPSPFEWGDLQRAWYNDWSLQPDPGAAPTVPPPFQAPEFQAIPEMGELPAAPAYPDVGALNQPAPSFSFEYQSPYGAQLAKMARELRGRAMLSRLNQLSTSYPGYTKYSVYGLYNR